MVGETLEVPAGKGDIHGGRSGRIPVSSGNRLEDARVQLVDPRVVGVDLEAQLEVARFEQLGDLVGNRNVELRQLNEGGPDALWNHILREAQAGQLRDVPGEIAHPLKRRTHSQGAHNHAQVTCNRSLEGEYVNRAFVEVVLQEVDACIRGDDFLCKLCIRCLERCGGLLHGLRNQLRDLDEFFADLVKLRLKNLTHVGVLSL
ncbi:hypothetical protein GCM10009784_16140 [Arthrobacter parietis]|uniref:Uncharacterized protein n=1 Tax=Arthrobacter parietis TaxID=271434 RepID=A0ABP5MKB6_9MICC